MTISVPVLAVRRPELKTSAVRLIAAALTLLATCTALGAEYSVGSQASCDYDDLDDAIAAASSGDTLRLRAETFIDEVTVDRSLTIIGGHINCGDSSPTIGNTTVIDSPVFGFAPLVSITGSSTQVSLSWLTLQDADSLGNGGGIYLDSYADLNLAQVVIKNNAATNGAGIYVDKNASLTTNGALTLSVIDNTAAGVGGGLYVGSGASIDLSASVVDISGNTADNAGGGIFASGNADLTLNNADINHNTSTTSGGGGLYSSTGTSDRAINISDSTFYGNLAGGSGGGLLVFGNSGAVKELDLANTIIDTNIAGSNGGGIKLAGALQSSLTDTTITGNTAGDNGGGIHSGSGGTMTALRLTVTNNSANDDGGGIWTRNDQINLEAEPENLGYIRDNSASRGGGLFIAGPGGQMPEAPSVILGWYLRITNTYKSKAS